MVEAGSIPAHALETNCDEQCVSKKSYETNGRTAVLQKRLIDGPVRYPMPSPNRLERAVKLVGGRSWNLPGVNGSKPDTTVSVLKSAWETVRFHHPDTRMI